MATKRPHPSATAPADDDDPVDPSDELMFLALGGGNEVGRSCHIIQYKGKTVMLDAGIHPAFDGLAALPFYDEFDLGTVDVLLVTHFHMDHAASLPYVLAKTPFKGRTYMTHPTKAIYKWLMQDSVRVSNTHRAPASSTSTSANDGGAIAQLYTEADVLQTLPQIQTISFNTTHTHAGIRITPYPAGHVLGACMYLIEIAGLSILFTGDYSRENDRHLIPATIPKGLKVDCLITESTFGISTHIPRAERETALMKSITGILGRGGRVLMPVFAIGMAQELLLILEDYWTRHPEYQRFPIYFASALARKCMVVYQTYIDSMNDNIRSKLHSGATTGPWDFEHIRSLKSLDRFDDVGGCIMLASPGMLQNGVSRALLERWAPDPKNGVVITGYSVEGTMAKEIMKEPDSIPSVMGQRNNPSLAPGRKVGEEKTMIPRRCTVQEFSFAAHVDGSENRAFIEEVNAPVVVLVHGERGNMMRMRSRLLGLGKFKVYSPANCEEVRIPFRRDKVAKVVGSLASTFTPTGETNGGDVKRPRSELGDGQTLSGILVQSDHKLSLMSPADLREYAGLATTTITCRQRITLAAASLDLILWSLRGTFGAVTLSSPSPSSDAETEDQLISIPDTAVQILAHAPSDSGTGGEYTLLWPGNAANDAIADAVMAVLMSVETSPAAMRHTSSPHSHTHSDEDLHPLNAATPELRLDALLMFLSAQFGEEALTPIATPRNAETMDEVGQAKELARLHGLGIPVPGIEVKVDSILANVWFGGKGDDAGVEVECKNRGFGERVRAVVEGGLRVVV
ncbi:hypothetical protein B0A48_18021 [Cryoendolithus antarcticus]|uniref:Uncharacterized protein n=1 Tax=Cryoendolithus antarcticus TaxID=1507870 RepID=A0A1V8SAS6_9PEZI|nr:hypothetical protein B0A48_18021 [Cryoendolithus antarcticus]